MTTIPTRVVPQAEALAPFDNQGVLLERSHVEGGGATWCSFAVARANPNFPTLTHPAGVYAETVAFHKGERVRAEIQAERPDDMRTQANLVRTFPSYPEARAWLLTALPRFLAWVDGGARPCTVCGVCEPVAAYGGWCCADALRTGGSLQVQR